MNYKKYKTPTREKDPSTIASYKTADLYLSAFLRVKGIMLVNVDKKNAKVIFIFKDDGNIQGLISEYFNDFNVRVLSYKAALRDLRSIIFDYQNFRGKKS